MRTHVCECNALVKNVGCTRIEQRGSLSDTSSPAACRWRNSDKEPHRCHSFFSQCYTLRCLKGIQLYNPLSAVLRNHQPLKKKDQAYFLYLSCHLSSENHSWIYARFKFFKGLALLNNEKNHPSINLLTWILRINAMFRNISTITCVQLMMGSNLICEYLNKYQLMEKIHFVGLKYY